MTDRSSTVPAPPSKATGATTDAAAAATAEYSRIYAEQQPRLVAYARSLTRNAWTAEDLVAEAHFRVWRRLAAGHEIDNVPAYLRTTVRHLAIASGTTTREAPSDPQAQDRAETGTHGEDPAERVAGIDLVVRVLGQLPERWAKALWLAEAEGQPLAAIGPQLGTKDGATAVLLHRAREGMRQAFLRAQTGAPDDPACQVHWARMPAYVRGAATARQSERLLGHVDSCDACRTALAALMSANDRLPAFVGPALLVLALGGGAKFLPVFTAAPAGATGLVGGHGAGVLHGMRHAVSAGARTPAATAGALVVGAAVACLVLGWPDSAPAPHPPAAGAPAAEAPLDRGPVAGTAVSPPPSPTAARAEDAGPSAQETDVEGAAPRAPERVGAPRGGTGAADQAARQPAPAAEPAARPTPAPADETPAEPPQKTPRDDVPGGTPGTPEPTPPADRPDPELPQTTDPEPDDPHPGGEVGHNGDDGHDGPGKGGHDGAGGGHGKGGHGKGPKGRDQGSEAGRPGCPAGPSPTGRGNSPDPRPQPHPRPQAGAAPDREAGHHDAPRAARPR
ncbi:RNA polymerase sigma factor (sigma-70 family) [Streptomyces achromogenes]|uniref:RNA polymerase sigma factor (Sigma-70 family) n=1 Tax=Streptomyces achromogenes TaxID=67255 RepID=A0ABU0PV83_STRAH|nr:sigma-70 family RNA polymerase sigma factor [Streptomyces achromogenes]MDQ0682300.1 RNA polymerase sigma factor (sigma-70 family) [Streptomyces achromogenes]